MPEKREGKEGGEERIGESGKLLHEPVWVKPNSWQNVGQAGGRELGSDEVWLAC